MATQSIEQKFILHWGEMGTRWGINRTMAQVHALLFLASEPRNAEQIAEALSVARSNVSTCLRELQGWGIVRIVHRLGDRRDYFQTETDVWTLFRTILDERKRREIDPTMALLRECVAELEAAGEGGEQAHLRQRIEALLGLLELSGRWYETVGKLPTERLVQLLKLGDRVLPRRKND